MQYYNKEGKTVAVIGSRSLTDTNLVYSFLDAKRDKIKLLVSGGAKRGPDHFANEWAKDRGFPILIFYPNWYNEHGQFVKSAGYARNYEIVQASDLIVCFYDGVSRGSQHSMDIAKSLKKPVQIITFTPIETL
jgi:hypothetical protein